MAYQKKEIKTKQEWDKIKFENSLGVNVGACRNKAVDLVIAKYNTEKTYLSNQELTKEITEWVDILYQIGKEKEEQILKDQEPKPLTKEDLINAQKMGEQVLENENQEEKEGLDNANYEVNEWANKNKGTNNIPF